MAHKEDCQYLYSFNFTENVGRTDGEQIERNWSKGKGNTASTREMNPGHRHDVLNDHHNSFNFDKLRNIGMPLHILVFKLTLRFARTSS